jgi:hypothetical protein
MFHRLTFNSGWQLFMGELYWHLHCSLLGCACPRCKVWTCQSEWQAALRGTPRAPTDEANRNYVGEMIKDTIERFTVLGGPLCTADLDPSNFHLFPKRMVCLTREDVASFQIMTSRERWICGAAEWTHSSVVTDKRNCLTVRETVRRWKIQDKL